MKPANLIITTVSIADLKPSVYNPRKWSEVATKQLKESMQRFGIVDRFWSTVL